MSNKDKGVNRDPLSGTPGSHPIGTGLGAAAGGIAAVAAMGSFAGPVGTIAGAAVGALVGGWAGNEAAEKIDPTIEEAYWRENFMNRTYVARDSTFDDYGPAYLYGIDHYPNHLGRTFDEVENYLSDNWHRAKGKSSLTWEQAKHATSDAWHRLAAGMTRGRPTS